MKGMLTMESKPGEPEGLYNTFILPRFCRLTLEMRDDECGYVEKYIIVPRVEGGLEIYPGTHAGLNFGTGELEENGVTVHVTGEAI